MSETKGKINPSGTISTTINLDRSVWKRFRQEVIERDLGVTEGIEEAFRLWLSGQPSKYQEDAGTNLQSSDKLNLDAGRNSPKIETSRPFLGKMDSLIQSVPDGFVPEVEEFLLQHAERAIHLLKAGGQNVQQRAANPPGQSTKRTKRTRFEELEDFPDHPRGPNRLPAKPA